MKILTAFISVLFLGMTLCSCEKAYTDEDIPTVSPGTAGDGGEPSGDNPGGYTTGDVVSVQEFIDNDITCQVFVVGYIVGDCTKSISNAEFAPPFNFPQALLVADDANETSVDRVMSVQLKSGSKWRQSLNLVEHPELYRRKIRIFGFKEKYLGVPGIKSIDGLDFVSP